MKMVFQLAFVCSVGLFGCGSQLSKSDARVTAEVRLLRPEIKDKPAALAVDRPSQSKVRHAF